MNSLRSAVSGHAAWAQLSGFKPLQKNVVALGSREPPPSVNANKTEIKKFTLKKKNQKQLDLQTNPSSRQGPGHKAKPSVTTRRSTSALPSGELACIHFSTCSGCSMNHGMSEPDQFIEARSFFESKGYGKFKMVAGPHQGWRCRAKLAVRGRPGDISVGLFRRASHDVVDIIPGCVVQHPRINEATALIKQMVHQLRIAPYDEKYHKGTLRYLQLTAVGREEAGMEAEQDSLASIQVVLVVNAEGSTDPALVAAKRLAAILWTYAGSETKSSAAFQNHQAPPLIHSIWINQHSEKDSNTVIGSGGWELQFGPKDIWQRFGGTLVSLGPGSFVQANYGAFQSVLERIKGFVPPDASITELHAGVGAIGLSLFSGKTMPRSLRCVEINAAAELPFKVSRSRLFDLLEQQHQGKSQGDLSKGDCSSNTRSPLPGITIDYMVAAAGDDPDRFLSGADVVIVDPPRKGLEPSLLAALCRGPPSKAVPLSKGQISGGIEAEGSDLNSPGTQSLLGKWPHTLIYLSCGWDALKSEFEFITGNKAGVSAMTKVAVASTLHDLQGACWELVHAEAFLFFPGTNSIETLCIFTRKFQSPI